MVTWDIYMQSVQIEKEDGSREDTTEREMGTGKPMILQHVTMMVITRTGTTYIGEFQLTGGAVDIVLQ